MLATSDAPAWIEAVGVSLSLIIAMILLWREQSDRTHRLAHHVAAWVEEGNPGRSISDPVRVLNDGDTPVYGCLVYAGWLGVYSKEFEFGLVPPHATRSREAVLSDGWAGQSESMLMNPDFRLVAEVSFTDAEGRHWLRKANGNLVNLKRRAVPGSRPSAASLHP